MQRGMLNGIKNKVLKMSNENQLKLFIASLVVFTALLFCFLGNPANQKKIENTDNFINKFFLQKLTNKNSDKPDFAPYMKRLQRKIKRNWNPPKADKSKRVLMLFKIAKNGELLDAKIIQSSGNNAIDLAAAKALKKSAPFEPLPKKFKGKSVDIQFTFDYNVLNR